MRRLLTLLVVMGAPALAAAAPGIMPVQGYLTDAAGTPVSASVVMRLTLYASGADPETTFVYRETQGVMVEAGHFTALVGTTTALDLAVFRDNPALVLGIKVGSDAEMTPRLTIGTTPYAGYAAYAGDADTVGGLGATDLAPAGAGVPTGAVMFFDLTGCPTGWSALAAAEGRVIVGLAAGGTLAGTSGTALADLETRTHTHAVDPAALTVTAPDHTHTVDPAVVTSTSYTHTHTVDPAAVGTTGAGSHNHAWLSWDNTNKDFSSYSSAGGSALIIDWNNGFSQPSGSGLYPVAVTDASPGGSSVWYTSNAGSHSHNVDVASTTSSSDSHTHDVNVAATTSSAGGAHAHSIDVPATTSTAVSATMPYVQLLACRKD